MTPTRQLAPPGTWCAIPVYNNGRTAATVARACREHVPHVVVVDDGSTDGGLDTALRDTDIVVLRHERRRGKGAALRTALDHVTAQGASWLITLDGDGQHLPEDIPRFFPRMEEDPDVLLVGCRDMTGADVPGASRFGRIFSNLWVFAETGLLLPDTQSGFRAYPVPRVHGLRLACNHFDFEIDVLVRHAWAGLPVAAVPVNAHYPPAAERVSHFDKWRDNVRLSRLHARLVARRLGSLVVGPLLAALTGALTWWMRRRRDSDAARARPDEPRPIQPRRRGNRLGFWCFGVATRLTGLRGAYGLLYIVCLHYLVFDHEAVASAIAYLRRRFPGRSRLRLLRDAYLLFVSQGKCLVDRHAALGGLRFDFQFHGMEQLAAAGGQGFIVLLAHVGNWQLVLTALGRFGRPVCLLMRPEDSPAVTDYLRVSSAGAELRIVSPESPFGGVIELMRYVAEGWIVCMMGDRGYHFQVAPVRFLGDTAHFPVGAFRIAAAAGCPVLFLFAWRSGERRYDVAAPLVCRPVYREGEDRGRQLQAWAQAFAAAVETFAVAHPYQVFLFQDVWTLASTLDDHEKPSSRAGRSRRIETDDEGLAGGNAS
jgi:predicted LPLAT superfamily acyltransferase